MARPKKHPPGLLDDDILTPDDFLAKVGKLSCPACRKQHRITIHRGQWGNQATCHDCGHQWPCGMAQPRADERFAQENPLAPVVPSEDDVPDQTFVSSWRDPGKCFIPD